MCVVVRKTNHSCLSQSTPAPGPHITPNEEMEERDKHQESRETKRGGEKEMDVAPVTIQQVFFHLIPLYKREVPVKTLTADL